MRRQFWIVAVLCTGSSFARAEPPTIPLKLSCNERLGPLEINRISLGQGGLSSESMLESRIAEIRALHPGLIRLFVQEYYQLLPEHGRYHFDTLDREVDAIVKTGASPLMCLCFKPRILFPTIDHSKVEPNDYDEWEKLVFNLVGHYAGRHPGKIRYWEIGSEVDIGESGGCPYLFQPESYVRYYRHTATAVLRADPKARVGGPALANVRSPILPALVNASEKERTPLDFVSWHIYSSSPGAIRGTIEYVKGLLAAHPGVKPETILDEWNMDLGNPPLAPTFQPCYALETAWQMKNGGLDWSCYYHIRDYHVDYDEFAPFFSPAGAAFMTRWWNRMPQADGLFDFQNHVRPAYFALKLLSRLTGERLRLDKRASSVHALATYDAKYEIYNLLAWNFSDSAADVELSVENLPKAMLMRQITLDASAAGDDENVRLRPRPPTRLPKSLYRQKVHFDPYGVKFWSFE